MLVFVQNIPPKAAAAFDRYAKLTADPFKNRRSAQLVWLDHHSQEQSLVMGLGPSCGSFPRRTRSGKEIAIPGASRCRICWE